MPEKKLLRPDEAAEMLRCSKKSIYNHYNCGDLPGLKIWGMLRFLKRDIDRIIDEAAEEYEFENRLESSKTVQNEEN